MGSGFLGRTPSLRLTVHISTLVEGNKLSLHGSRHKFRSPYVFMESSSVRSPLRLDMCYEWRVGRPRVSELRDPTSPSSVPGKSPRGVTVTVRSTNSHYISSTVRLLSPQSRFHSSPLSFQVSPPLLCQFPRYLPCPTLPVPTLRTSVPSSRLRWDVLYPLVPFKESVLSTYWSIFKKNSSCHRYRYLMSWSVYEKDT